MPGFNQRGPLNQGPMTGRRQGICASGGQIDPANDPGYAAPPMGFGRRCGMGRQGRWGGGYGRGYGYGYGRMQGVAPVSDPNETLLARAQRLEAELNAIKQELSAAKDE